MRKVAGGRAAALIGGVLLAVVLSGCSSSKKETYVEKPVDELYNSAMDLLAKEDYSKAADAFDEVEQQHPYSVWATRAQLMSAYALYQANKYDDSIVAADRYIQLHPGNRDVAYAYYLKALDYYVQIEDVGRDQKTTEQAMQALEEVVRRFPNTPYARDARLKMDLARDHLAGKEMEIGRWYEKQGYYLAALNRFKTVIDKYQTTTHAPEALERLTECYLALGLKDEAKRTAAVLGYNYPGSAWYAATYTLVTGQEVAVNGGTTPPAAPPSPAAASTKDNEGWFGKMLGFVF
ncbi:MAG: outer membrane protein assembly factor BamD [Alphaproteobacteria bacterium]|nr:outer membrane protein assembly factor BamD [Alphaproteobacteria bacterium]